VGTCGIECLFHGTNRTSRAALAMSVNWVLAHPATHINLQQAKAALSETHHLRKPQPGYLLICGGRNDFLPRQNGTTGKSVARAKTCPALARKIFLLPRRANQ